MSKVDLMPTSLSTYIGQEKIKDKAQTYIDVFKDKGIVMPHTLVVGSPGLGKTSVVRALANDLGVEMIEAFGPSLKEPEDIYRLFVVNDRAIQNGAVVFIDEIHSVNLAASEILFPAMQDFVAQWGMDKYDLPRFTLLGATTDPGKMLQPLRDRFLERFELISYTDSELATIGHKSALKLGYKIGSDALDLLASISCGTPRLMNGYVLSLNYWRMRQGIQFIDKPFAKEYLKWRDIDLFGCGNNERKYVAAMYKNDNQPAGIVKLTKITGLPTCDIEHMVEKVLLRNDMLVYSNRGRQLSEFGMLYAEEVLTRGIV